MNLIKTIWKENDITEFQDYLKSFSDTEEKCNWVKNIVKTNLPCLAIKSKKIQEISKEIMKGNFLSFISFWNFETYENTLILGNLICKIKDFEPFKNKLLFYISKCDNWASIDTLKFKITKENKNQFLDLAKQLAKSDKTFIKRTAIIILFNFIDDENIDTIFNILNSFKNEKEYYVNMANAWLICECFIKKREKTLNFLKNNENLNNFTINKAISKCRDSFRVSKEDKNFLLKFKK